MVENRGIPILWHIMMHYSCYGFNEFAIALVYKGEYIKKYMLDYAQLSSNLTVDMSTGASRCRAGIARTGKWIGRYRDGHADGRSH